MFNVGGAELLVILVVALIVLGPDKLPEAARKIGQFMGQMRQYSAGFQNELRNALDEPIETKARERGAKVARPAAEDPDPENLRSESSASESSASENGASENGASENGASENGVSKPLAKPVRSAPAAPEESSAPRRRAPLQADRESGRTNGTSRTRSTS